jgi:hypothetical protein
MARQFLFRVGIKCLIIFQAGRKETRNGKITTETITLFKRENIPAISARDLFVSNV